MSGVEPIAVAHRLGLRQGCDGTGAFAGSHFGASSDAKQGGERLAVGKLPQQCFAQAQHLGRFADPSLPELKVCEASENQTLEAAVAPFTGKGKGLFIGQARLGQPLPFCMQDAEPAEGQAFAEAVADLAGHGKRSRVVGACLVASALIVVEHAKAEVEETLVAAVPHLVRDGERGREVFTGLVLAALFAVHDAQVPEGDAFEAPAADLTVYREGCRHVLQ